MTQASTAPGKARYLVHGACGSSLADFLALAETDPDITVADLIGPRGQPHTAVLEITAETAQRLQRQFRHAGTPSHQLTIEPDRPLSMYDSGAFGPI